MKVHKFGGASIKDAISIKNVISVLKTVGYKDSLIVVSAIGDTTNILEKLVKKYFLKKDFNSNIQIFYKNHKEISDNLFPLNHLIFNEINICISTIISFFKKNKSKNYNFVYDQIVSFGEIISSKIISEYLKILNIKNEYINAKNYIQTDSNYREANINWGETNKKINSIKEKSLYITQGFIGSDYKGFTTTLGREGSDYTASIFSWCLNNVDSQTIWKNVPGVLNADPKYFSNTKLLKQISYVEAMELSYYGASIIHPKTIYPLQDKKIILYVRSFLDLKNSGTCIKNGPSLIPIIPCYTLKKNQIIISLSKINFTHIDENCISKIFNKIYNFSIKVNLIQNSSIFFTICIEDIFNKYEDFINKFKKEYKIKIIKNVSLYTLRNYNNNSIKKFLLKKNILLKQYTMNTAQLVVEE